MIDLVFLGLKVDSTFMNQKFKLRKWKWIFIAKQVEMMNTSLGKKYLKTNANIFKKLFFKNYQYKENLIIFWVLASNESYFF